MAIHFMSMRGVPDDELEEICTLLDQHKISYYETPPGNWLISAGAIWLTNQEQLVPARALLDEYQQQRLTKAREEYTQHQLTGEEPGVIDRIKENPVRFIGYLAIIIFILYISIMPFIDFGQ
ncbi:MAG: DUF6164 family protein [Gammaproteobacteria bacterium]|nr:DUF6164 family protein [Gammaproteobacteria bacterium]MDX2486678.1 DUF6164 family protein [Gammaproteobacteria bacterium]